ncbi:ribonuclease HII [Numidum massiliense]|uniref:ribonuclease HII n=1 Tax=Numidum massiliense TaxID=1522315 RepID=UPI0006D56E40|nr:ribonuclease HII [Numidum massiliense]
MRVQLTIREIKEQLAQGDVSREWIDALEADERRGVQQLLAQWERRQTREQTLRDQWHAMTTYERHYWRLGKTLLAGVDEVGRGPLAGPVVAAAVILPPDAYLPGLNDSKKLSASERERLYGEIVHVALDWQTAIVPVARIDEVNIYHATLEAMTAAVKSLRSEPQLLLNDAVHLKEIAIAQEKIVAGDARSISIAAASIVAKVTRDRLMAKLAETYEGYGFERNMGYGTAEHLQALRTNGPTPEHRRSFAPVKEVCRSK